MKKTRSKIKPKGSVVDKMRERRVKRRVTTETEPSAIPAILAPIKSFDLEIGKASVREWLDGITSIRVVDSRVVFFKEDQLIAAVVGDGSLEKRLLDGWRRS